MDPIIGIIIGIASLIGTGLGVYYSREQLLAILGRKKIPPTPPSLPPPPSISDEQNVLPSDNTIATLPPTDFDDSKYREWLSEETGFIDIRGIRIGTTPAKNAMRFPILDLYTELNVQKGLTNWDLDQGTLLSGQRIPLTNVLEATRCVAIAGDPGSGKTTFLRYVARKFLQDNPKILPVYLDLPDLYKFAIQQIRSVRKEVENIEGSVEIESDFIVHYLMAFSDKENLGLNAVGLLNRIQNGRIIFLFDSLDELPSPAAREPLVDNLSKISRRWDKCKFAIASRPLALTGKAIPIGFEIVGIEPLQNEEIRNFLNRWSFQLFGRTPRQKSFYEELYSNIIENQQLRSLARNPVMLTCMAVLSYNNRQLPAGRADLLEAAIQWLISSKEEISARPAKETPKFIDARYSQLALAMFELKSDSKNRVGRRWTAVTIASYFGNDESRALDFLEREENQSGLLVRRGEGDLAFWHSWFLDYLAAKEIASRTDDEKTGWWSKIKDHLNDTQWREVIALVPACLNRLGSNRVDLFFERVSDTCVSVDLPTKIRTLGFGGRILRDLLILGYDPGKVPSWNRLLEDISPIFQHSPNGITIDDRYEAAVAYGLSGDRRLKIFEDTWVKVPAGVFLMGAQSIDREMPNFDEFANPWEGPIVEINLPPFEIRKYPITVLEYKAFLEHHGYQNVSFWSEEGWKWRTENNVNSPAH